MKDCNICKEQLSQRDFDTADDFLASQKNK